HPGPAPTRSGLDRLLPGRTGHGRGSPKSVTLEKIGRPDPGRLLDRDSRYGTGRPHGRTVQKSGVTAGPPPALNRRLGSRQFGPTGPRRPRGGRSRVPASGSAGPARTAAVRAAPAGRSAERPDRRVLTLERFGGLSCSASHAEDRNEPFPSHAANPPALR